MGWKANARWRVFLVAAAVSSSLVVIGPPAAQSHGLIPQLAQALVPPAGFGQSVFAELQPGDLATSLTFGTDGRLYVAAVQGVAVGESFQSLGAGRIYAFEDLGGVAGPPQIVASGFNQVLGITFGPDGTLYVADNVNNKGSVIALSDGNDDGTYEQRRVILKNIPNGRHQTNGMSFGPDGSLYVTNGSATDNGLECGPEPASPLACPTPEVKPWTGSILRLDPAWENVDLMTDVVVDANEVDDPGVLDDEQVLVAEGFRNIFDLDFSPSDSSVLYTPMNGSDNPASNEPLYRTDVSDQRVVSWNEETGPVYGPRIDDAGFPSCSYGQHVNKFPTPDVGGHEHPDSFEPEDSLKPEVIERFGPCDKGGVLKPIMFFAEAHNGVSGLAFERGDNFPDRYDGSLFVAEWGSMWNLNGGEANGHKITQVDFNGDGSIKRRRTFMSGGAPMDLTFGPGGEMFVADFHGSIYRVANIQDTPDQMTVEIHNGQFVPQVITVPHGVTVVWANLDTVPHSVVGERAVIADDPSEQPLLQAGDELDSHGDIPPRKWYSYEFGDDTGLWQYHSTTTTTDDAAMRGIVFVVPVDR